MGLLREASSVPGLPLTSRFARIRIQPCPRRWPMIPSRQSQLSEVAVRWGPRSRTMHSWLKSSTMNVARPVGVGSLVPAVMRVRDALSTAPRQRGRAGLHWSLPYSLAEGRRAVDAGLNVDANGEQSVTRKEGCGRRSADPGYVV